jgi:hypothetical protein
MVKDSSLTVTISAKPIEVKARRKKDEEKKEIQRIKEVYQVYHVQLCDDEYYEPFYWKEGSFQKHVHWN